MCVCTYESLQKSGHILKILESGNATGEIRIYKNLKKNIELIEHAQISNAVYGYGVDDAVQYADIE